MPFQDDDVIKARIHAYVRERDEYEARLAQVEHNLAKSMSIAERIMKMLGM